jgi:hypothetical protein
VASIVVVVMPVHVEGYVCGGSAASHFHPTTLTLSDSFDMIVDDNHIDSVPGAAEASDAIKAHEVVYYAICTFPPEVASGLESALIMQYCEFSGSLTKCKSWLKGEHPDLFDKLYSAGISPPPIAHTNSVV